MFRKAGRPSSTFRLAVLVMLLALVAQAGWQLTNQQNAAPQVATNSNTPRLSSVTGAPAAPVSNQPAVAQAPFEVGRSVKNDVSPPLRAIKPIPATPWTQVREMAERDVVGNAPAAPYVKDPVVQSSFGPSALAMPAPIVNFDGVGNVNGVYPPDTNGDVGPNHFVQWVNLSFQIWNKSGVSLYGPAAGNTLWSGFGGACQSQNAGDPVVLYDSKADRWLMSQFTSSAPYGECIAISQTGDPTGTYYRYFFQFSTTVFYDYPHLGVWPDGYYMGANRFSGNFYTGGAAVVFDRAKMLAGQPATFQAFNTSTTYGTLLPSDLDGPTASPAGSPNFFASRGASQIYFFKFHTDWATPANSTFSGPTSLPVAAYNQLCGGTRSCIPQPGTSVGLDGLGDRLMYRLAYRNFGDHELLVLNHAVNVASSGVQAGVRWYEIRNPNAGPTIYQQGTYAPDSTNRWLGSVAMDGSGNMALGFSAASSSVYAGIRYTGRLAGDPLGTMPQGETTLISGGGSQTGTASRWGDYAMMTVDPSDDCTFWFTTEYMPSTGGAPWKTRVGSFKFTSCGGGPTPTPAPPTNTPVPPTPTNTPVPPTATNTPNPNGADFSLSVTPPSQTLARSNGSAAYTVNLTSLNGFSGNVNLSVSGVPNKTSGSFSPGTVTLTSGGSGSSTLTITAQRNGPTGPFTLTVTATGNGVTHSQNVTLNVTR